MNKLLIASVALLGFAGIAAAQEVPAFYGDYAVNVQNSDGGAPTDRMATASVSSQRSAGLADTGGFEINQNENYSGK